MSERARVDTYIHVCHCGVLRPPHLQGIEDLANVIATTLAKNKKEVVSNKCHYDDVAVSPVLTKAPQLHWCPGQGLLWQQFLAYVSQLHPTRYQGG